MRHALKLNSVEGMKKVKNYKTKLRLKTKNHYCFVKGSVRFINQEYMNSFFKQKTCNHI